MTVVTTILSGLKQQQPRRLGIKDMTTEQKPIKEQTWIVGQWSLAPQIGLELQYRPLGEEPNDIEVLPVYAPNSVCH